MSVFLDNAKKIFDVAVQGGHGEDTDFALVVRDDGGLHLIMDSPSSAEGAAVHAGARTAYQVVRSRGTVRVTGLSSGQRVVLEERGRSFFGGLLMRDQPLYRIAPPLLSSAGA